MNLEAVAFDFRSHCIFCGGSYSNTLKKEIGSVTSDDTKQNILQNIQKKKTDNISKAIVARFKNVPDLVAV